MHARWAIPLFVASAAGLASAGDPKPTPVDLKPFRDKLVVLEDGGGGVVLVLPGPDARVWFATSAKAPFYEQIVGGRSSDAGAGTWIYSTYAPRVSELRPGSVQRRDDGTFRKWCGNTDSALTLVTADRAKPILDKAQVLTSAIIRTPHLLARDETGTYYYIDKIREALGGAGYRVFVGKKGDMKPLPLTDVAIDQAGDVFATKTGEVRLVHDEAKPTAVWVKGEKRTSLTIIDTDTASRLIFKDLGVYTFLGTLCDDI